MKLNKLTAALLFCGIGTGLSTYVQAQAPEQSSMMLAAKLSERDSLLFVAVLQTCDQQTIESAFATDFEYYQDKGDLQPVSVTSRAEFIGNIKNRCERGKNGPKVRRTTGNLQVFLMDNNRAMQTGIQRFYVTIPGQGDQLVEVSRFSRTWMLEKGEWKIERELDNVLTTPGSQSDAMKAQPVYKEIAHTDSVLFNAFNRFNFDTFKTFFAPDLEFYHDKNGFTGYAWNMENFKKHFDDPSLHVRRELVEGSLEVYPINNYGAVEIGIHRFFGKENGQEKLEATAKFITLWQKKDGQWKITREISFDHQ